MFCGDRVTARKWLHFTTILSQLDSDNGAKRGRAYVAGKRLTCSHTCQCQICTCRVEIWICRWCGCARAQLREPWLWWVSTGQPDQKVLSRTLVASLRLLRFKFSGVLVMFSKRLIMRIFFFFFYSNVSAIVRDRSWFYDWSYNNNVAIF